MQATNSKRRTPSSWPNWANGTMLELHEIPDMVKANYRQLLHAFVNDKTALLVTTRKDNGEPAYLVCAVNVAGETEEYVPYAELIVNDPFEVYEQPAVREPEGGFQMRDLIPAEMRLLQAVAGTGADGLSDAAVRARGASSARYLADFGCIVLRDDGRWEATAYGQDKAKT